MADSPRDTLMRLTGELKGALQLLEGINVPHGQKRVYDLVDTALRTTRKAMLAAWEEADRVTEGKKDD